MNGLCNLNCAKFLRPVRLRVFLDKCRNSQDDVHELQGKTVEVSGLVKLYKGKPEIVLESPSQLKTE